MLRGLIRERLMAAADEIFALFERTVASYEEELSRTREEKERHRQQLEAACKTQIVLHVEDAQLLVGHQEERPRQPKGESVTSEEEDPQPPHVKDEEEDPQDFYVKMEEEGLWTTHEEKHLLGQEEADITKLPPTVASVKTEENEDKPPESLQLHHSPSEDNRGAESPNSSSPRHMATEVGN
ncbi:uncharacterized protein LOC129179735 isoform X2 [Dunckerocampus dactyliophorus]|uniref:uncharacterized protein LOC129179735 isoform X2 n=1 Tax=Dunckerocampus dactyliophorus TaxID=161453 RepID=UPI002407340B|nr:uncharacterized protein LOC129179735 isoform X2 [Dunckerocampus dactyliophorus]